MDLSGQKGQYIGGWKRDKPLQQPSSELVVAALGDNVTITNVNDTTGDVVYFFSVTVVDGSVEYESDPELIVRKKPS